MRHQVARRKLAAEENESVGNAEIARARAEYDAADALLQVRIHVLFFDFRSRNRDLLPRLMWTFCVETYG